MLPWQDTACKRMGSQEQKSWVSRICNQEWCLVCKRTPHTDASIATHHLMSPISPSQKTWGAQDAKCHTTLRHDGFRKKRGLHPMDTIMSGALDLKGHQSDPSVLTHYPHSHILLSQQAWLSTGCTHNTELGCLQKEYGLTKMAKD